MRFLPIKLFSFLGFFAIFLSEKKFSNRMLFELQIEVWFSWLQMEHWELNGKSKWFSLQNRKKLVFIDFIRFYIFFLFFSFLAILLYLCFCCCYSFFLLIITIIIKNYDFSFVFNKEIERNIGKFYWNTNKLRKRNK